MTNPSASFRRTARVTILLLAGVLLGSGCATRKFNQEWNRAALGPASTDPLVGRWSGTWLSDKNGHTGELRCLITHAHGKNYRFDYWSTFWKVCRYRTTLTFRVEQEDGVARFEGSEDLGDFAGGVYHYNGSFKDGEFTATYTNRYDRGTFQMRRVD